MASVGVCFCDIGVVERIGLSYELPPGVYDSLPSVPLSSTHPLTLSNTPKHINSLPLHHLIYNSSYRTNWNRRKSTHDLCCISSTRYLETCTTMRATLPLLHFPPSTPSPSLPLLHFPPSTHTCPIDPSPLPQLIHQHTLDHGSK